MAAESVLIVVAHPDDDVLGAGGTAFRLAQRGIPVRAAILCGRVEARGRRPSDSNLADDIHQATAILGMQPPVLGDFPNLRMNTVDHLDMVQFVENAPSASTILPPSRTLRRGALRWSVRPSARVRS